MIAKSLKNAVDIRKNNKIAFNVIKGTDIVHYYIPDSYVELEYIIDPDGVVLDRQVEFDDNGVLLNNKVPVRRLGDGICGLFDTLNQVFKPSPTVKQYKGGPVKCVEGLNYNYNILNSSISYKKESDSSIGKKSFVHNTLNRTDGNVGFLLGTSVYVPTVSTNPYTSNANFTRYFPHNDKTNSLYVQHINPNWTILKGRGVTNNTYETANQNLYFTNKDTVEIVPTGNKKGDPGNKRLNKSEITRIIHIPYLQFNGTQTSFINIGPIETTTDTTMEVCVGGLDDRARTILHAAYGGRTDKWRSLNMFIDDPNTNESIKDISYNNGVSEQDTYCVIEKSNFNPIDCIRVAPHELLKKYTKTVISGGSNFRNLTLPTFYLGNGQGYESYNQDAPLYNWDDKICYFRIERKNSLYKHYIPASIFDIHSRQYVGFYEVVEQVFYMADLNTVPATVNDVQININGDSIVDAERIVNPDAPIDPRDFGRVYLVSSDMGITNIVKNHPEVKYIDLCGHTCTVSEDVSIKYLAVSNGVLNSKHWSVTDCLDLDNVKMMCTGIDIHGSAVLINTSNNTVINLSGGSIEVDGASINLTDSTILSDNNAEAAILGYNNCSIIIDHTAVVATNTAIYSYTTDRGILNTVQVEGGEVSSNDKQAIEVINTTLLVQDSIIRSLASAQNVSIPSTYRDIPNNTGYCIILNGDISGNSFNGSYDISTGNTYETPNLNSSAPKCVEYDNGMYIEIS